MKTMNIPTDAQIMAMPGYCSNTIHNASNGDAMPAIRHTQTRIVCNNTISDARTLAKVASRCARKAINQSPIDKAIARNARRVFRARVSKQLATFAASVRRETASARQAIYEAGDMIASGLVRFPSMMPQGVIQTYVGKRNAWRPALPSNQKMPPDRMTDYCKQPLFHA